MYLLTPETPSSEDHLEAKLQAKFDKYNQNFDQQQEDLMDFKEI